MYLNATNYQNEENSKESVEYSRLFISIFAICKLTVQEICNDGRWNWWIAQIGIQFVC